MAAVQALQSQVRVFNAVLTREINAKLTGYGGISFVASLLEPVLHITIVCLWHYLVRFVPVYGTSKVLFVATGLYPVFIFIHLSSLFHGSFRQRRFPLEHVLDIVAAQALLKLIGYLVVGVLLFDGIYIFITPQGIPFDFGPVLLAVAALSILGIGIGICNAVVVAQFPMWRYIYGPIARLLILFSGVLFVPDFLPAHLRKYLAWNPVMHAVDLFRQGFYPGYPRVVYDAQFLWACAFGALVLGLCLERIYRRKMEAR